MLDFGDLAVVERVVGSVLVGPLSRVSYMRKNKGLFGKTFLEQVFDCLCQVAVVIWLHDLLGKFDKQRAGNIVKCKVFEEVIFSD